MGQRVVVLVLALGLQAALIGMSNAQGNKNGQGNNNGQGSNQRDFKELPANLKVYGAKLASNDLTSFRDSLSASMQTIFDAMKNANSCFDVIGKRPGQVQRALKCLASSGCVDARLAQAVQQIPCQGLNATVLALLRESVTALFKDSAVQTVAGSVSEADRASVCAVAVDYQDAKFIYGMFIKFNCVRLLQSLDVVKSIFYNASNFQRRVILKAIRTGQSDASKWNLGMAAIALAGGASPQEIKKIPQAVMDAIITNDFFEKSLRDIDEEKRVALCFFYSTWSTMDRATASKVRGNLCLCPERLSEIPSNVFLSVVGDLECESTALDLALKKNMPAPNQLSATDAPKYLKTILNDPSILRKLGEDIVMALLPEIRRQANGLSPSQERNFLRRLLKTNTFKNAATLTAANLASMTPGLLGRLPNNYISRIPCSVLGDASVLALASKAEYDNPRKLRATVGRCSAQFGLTNLGNANAATLRQLGQLLGALKPQQWDQIPGSAIMGALSVLKTTRLPRPVYRIIIRKIKGENGGTLRGKCGELGRLFSHLSNKDLKVCGISGLNFNKPTFDLGSIPSNQIRYVIREFLKTLPGGLESLIADPTKGYLLKKIVSGVDISDLKAIAATINPEILQNMAEAIKDMDPAQAAELGQQAMSFVAAIPDPDESERIVGLVVYAKNFDTKFHELSPNLQRRIARKLHKVATRLLTRNAMKKLLKIMNKHRPDSTNSDNDVDKSSCQVPLKGEDVKAWRNLVPGMEPCDVMRISLKELKAPGTLELLCEKADEVIKTKIAERMVTEEGNLHTNTELLSNMAGCTPYFPQVFLDKISDIILEKVYMVWFTKLEEIESYLRLRSKDGFQDEISAEVLAMRDQGLGRVVVKSLPAMSTSSVKRRRRATSALTCQNLKGMGENAKYVAASEISTLSNSDFVECIQAMNKYTGWAQDRRQAFTTVGKKARGSNTATWTSDQIQEMGSIVASGLTEAELGSLDLSSSDTASALGNINYYQSHQLKALFNRYLGSNQKQPNTLTGDDLNNMGVILCGATDTQIASMQFSAYEDAASSIGSLTCFEAGQLMAFANHAKAAFGALNTWTTSTVDTVGTVIGGVGSDITQLSTNQLASLDTASIQAIPPSTMALMSPAQLGGLAPAQANAITATQQASMEPEQLEAVSGAGGTVKTGAAHRAAPATLLIVIVAFFVIKMA